MKRVTIESGEDSRVFSDDFADKLKISVNDDCVYSSEEWDQFFSGEELPPKLSKLEMDHIKLMSDRNHLHAAVTYVESVLSRVSAFGDDIGPNVSKAEIGTALQSLRAAVGREFGVSTVRMIF